MKQYVDHIFNQTDYDSNCRGLQEVDSATFIAKHYFEIENVSFENWCVCEIPLVDGTGEYPVAVVVDVINREEEKSISLNLTRDGKLFKVSVYADDEVYDDEIYFDRISEAIKHPKAKYEVVFDGAEV